MDNPFVSPTILSFCPGILGLERGLERAIGKFTVAAYCEIEAFICANLVTGMETGILAPAPIWTDAKTFPSQYFRGKIHGIIGGYPCQPFTVSGDRKGESDPRHLWPFFRNRINTIKPFWCLFENVAGHLTLGYEQVKRDLEEMGYLIKEGIYSAEEVAANQKRERLFILALANSCSSRNEAWLSETKQRQKGFSEIINHSSLGSQWVAAPDKKQYEWEAPRLIPSMVSTFHGYNFREDLLRAYGNSVVEQTAEIAFIDLLNKHLK